MRIFAYVTGDAIIGEIIPGTVTFDGIDYDITERYTPQFLEMCADITDEDPMPGEWWGAVKGEDGKWTFTPPATP